MGLPRLPPLLLIINYARFEYSYEDFYKKSGSHLPVTLDLYKDGAYVVTDCETHPPSGPALKKANTRGEGFCADAKPGSL